MIGIALPGLIGLSGSSPKESRCAKWGEYQCMKKAPPGKSGEAYAMKVFGH